MVSLLFSFRGRIDRRRYWLGATLAGFISGVGQMLAMAASGHSLADAKAPADLLGAVAPSLIPLPLYGLSIWATLAVQFKRFHDRGRTGWFAMAPLLVIVMAVATFLSDVGAAKPEALLGDLLPWMALLALVSFAMFIDLGCLPGVDEPNQYDLPPGARGPSAPQRPSGAVDAASALFGAQSAMDRAIAEARSPQPAPAAAAPAFARAATPTPAPTGFGRRVAR